MAATKPVKRKKKVVRLPARILAEPNDALRRNLAELGRDCVFDSDPLEVSVLRFLRAGRPVNSVFKKLVKLGLVQPPDIILRLRGERPKTWWNEFLLEVRREEAMYKEVAKLLSMSGGREVTVSPGPWMDIPAPTDQREHRAFEMFKQFLKAIERKDGYKSIERLAATLRRGDVKLDGPADGKRAVLLRLKEYYSCVDVSQRPTAGDIAGKFDWDPCQVHRIAKRLGFVLRKDRVGRPSKRQTRDR